MNHKEDIMCQVLDLVLQCTAYTRHDGTISVTREDVVGPERKSENIGMIRCILCRVLSHLLGGVENFFSA